MPSEGHSRQILKSIGILMGALLLSRLLGFAREWTVAHQMGSNSITDAYYAAFMLPDFLTYMVAGGSLEIFFIHVFAKYIAETKEHEAWHLFSAVLPLMIVLLLPLLFLPDICASRIVRIIAPVFNPSC